MPAVQEQELQVNRQLEFYKRLFFASLIALLLLMAYQKRDQETKEEELD